MSGFANPYRGEVQLRLGDREYRLRPSFAALVQAEAEIGSLVGLAKRAGAGEVRFAEVVALLHCAIEAGGIMIDRDQLGEMVAIAGLAAVSGAFRDLLSVALTGRLPDAQP